jgi:hypothetical protein
MHLFNNIFSDTVEGYPTTRSKKKETRLFECENGIVVISLCKYYENLIIGE